MVIRRIFVRALFLFLALIVLALIVGFFLPREYEVRTSIDIQARPSAIFPLINQLQEWPKWSSWNPQSIDGLEIQYSGPPSGKGAIQKWNEPRGSGKLWITDSQPDRAVFYQLTFDRFPVMNGSIQLAPSGAGTTVTWRSDGRLPSGPFYGWFGLMFEPVLREQYDQGLNKLKTLVEGPAD